MHEEAGRPLIIAAYMDVVHELLKNKTVDLNVKGHRGHTALIAACLYGVKQLSTHC